MVYFAKNGNTALELDLNEFPGSPDAFNYSDPFSIDELNEHKSLVIEQQKARSVYSLINATSPIVYKALVWLSN